MSQELSNKSFFDIVLQKNTDQTFQRQSNGWCYTNEHKNCKSSISNL